MPAEQRFEPKDPQYAERVRASFARQDAMKTIGATLAILNLLRSPTGRAGAGTTCRRRARSSGRCWPASGSSRSRLCSPA